MSYRNTAYEQDRTQVFEATRSRSILRNVYLWMAGGLALTAFVALFISKNESAMRYLVTNRGVFFAVFIAEFAIVIFLSARIQKMSAAAATLSFAVYAILNGITLSLIFLIYTKTSIVKTFFITAGTFGAMSIYGYSTKRELSGIGHYLIMALIGVIIGSLVNIFLKSTALEWVISFAGIAIFVGLTAWDTQIIKRWSEELSDKVSEEQYLKLSILGALKLYLDFINLFLFFLRIFGRRN